MRLALGSTAKAIDHDARTVVTEAGARIGYDALVLATGSINRVLPMFPPGRGGIHYLRTEADARALKARLHQSRSLLVIGGGLIGLEVAASAAALGVKTSVIEIAPRILARACNAEIAALIHERHATRGVDLCIDTAPRELRELADGRLAVETHRGAITADLITDPVRGTAYGVLGTVNGMGDLVASVVVGSLWTAFSPVLAFAYAALMMGTGAVVMYRTR